MPPASNAPHPNPTRIADPPPEDEAPELPGLRGWRAVYGVVAAIYVLQLALLTWIARLDP